MNFNNVEFESSYAYHSQLPPSDLPEFAFSGRSNVGKSSMINKLLARKAIARVSQTPGKTATINFYNIDKHLRLADLPGYGYAKVSKSEKRKWAELIEGYFSADRNLQLIIQLIDIRHPPTADDINMISFMIDKDLPFIVVLTKQDKLSQKQQQERMELLMEEIPYFDQINIVPFSSKTGSGVDQVKAIICDIEAECRENCAKDEN